MKLYQFIWHEFCDWYIELSKEPLKAGGERQAGARWVLINVFDKMLRLLHPFMPFVSEEIWQVIRPYLDEAESRAASADREVSRSRRRRNPLSAAEEARDESLHRGDRGDQLAALVARMASRPARHGVSSNGRASTASRAIGDVATVRDDTRETRESSNVHRESEDRATCLRICRGPTSVSMRLKDFDFEVARQKLREATGGGRQAFCSARSAVEGSNVS